MLVRVEPASDRPIYQQIVAQVTYAVAAETLRPGQAIPSVRELAGLLLLNPNTVARAYRQLQAEGIVRRRRGRGLFVTAKALGICRQARAEQVRQRLREVLAEAVSSELPPEEIEQIVAEELAALAAPTPAKGK